MRVPPAALLKPRRPPLWKRLAVWTGGAAATALVLALVYLILNPRADVGAKPKSDRPPAGLETVTNSVGMVLARVPAGMWIRRMTESGPGAPAKLRAVDICTDDDE